MNKRNLYWTLQISGWLLYVFINYLSLPLFPDRVPYEEVYFFGSFFNGILVTHLYRSIIRNFNWFNLPLLKLIRNIFAGALIATIVFFIAQTLYNIIIVLSGEYFLHLNLHGRRVIDPSYWAYFYLSMLNIYFVFMLWSVMYFVFQYFENFQSAKIKALKAESQLKDATLQNLRNQINPHFLFNALNSIKSLTIAEPENARKATTLLSDILRYSLNSEKKTYVLLEEELAVTKDYLQLEKIRFGDRLDFSFEIEDATLKNYVPPLLLLTFAENAIKHGISKSKEGGTIKVRSVIENNFHLMQVINTGSYNESDIDLKGIGISNTKQRLDLLYEGRARMMINNTANGQVTAAIYIPVNQMINLTDNINPSISLNN
ncbi:MAG: histidine kinase [Bacteroidia bacterium]